MENKATIICPKCHTQINIEDALYSQLQTKFDADLKEKREQYKKAQLDLQQKEETLQKNQEQFEDKLQDALTLRMKAKEQDLRASIQKEMMDIKEHEEALLKAELDKKSKELLTMQQEADRKLQEALQQSKKEQETQIKAQLEQDSALKVKELEDALQAKSVQIQEFEASKAEIAKLKMQMAEAEAKAKSEAQIEFYEKLAEEKQKVIQEVNTQNELKIKEKDEQIAQISRKLEETQQQAQQGSMQLQGESQEVIIEEWLKEHFRLDTIEEVPKGVYGADCIQTVNTIEAQNCGVICYESKNTKSWSNDWIVKLKQDMIKVNADIGVLVTTTMPKNMESMGFVDGIWVCTLNEFKGSVLLLRESLINIQHVLSTQENKSDKMNLLYNYLTGNEFSMQLKSIVDGFISMQSELDKQKRSNMSSWKRQQKMIDTVINNTTDMYGSIKGITGNAIGNVKALELEYLEEEEEE